VTHVAALPYFLEAACMLREEAGRIKKERTIIFVGNIKKHKGLSCLLDAFFAARSRGLDVNLIIVGEKNIFRSSNSEVLRRIQGSDAVRFTGFVGDDELCRLIQDSALLVQPSLYEGFCLPPLEAMCLGAQALISDIPVLHEIYAGFPVTYFRAGDAGDLADKLIELLYNREPEVVHLSAEQTKKYTFEKTAAIILGELR
jgi:glycosyltransferase involved in cell wall biosynthesis